MIFGNFNLVFYVFKQNKRAQRIRKVRTPDMYAAFMQQAEEERFWPAHIPRMTSHVNPWGLPHTTFLTISHELRFHPYSKKRVSQDKTRESNE